jgi:hypothetical protein
MTALCGTPQLIEPVYWIIFCALSCGMLIRNKSTLWIFGALIGAVSLGNLLAYFFGTAQYVSFSESSFSFDQGLKGFSRATSAAILIFAGIEFISFSGDDMFEVSQFVCNQ